MKAHAYRSFEQYGLAAKPTFPALDSASTIRKAGCADYSARTVKPQSMSGWAAPTGTRQLPVPGVMSWTPHIFGLTKLGSHAIVLWIPVVDLWFDTTLPSICGFAAIVGQVASTLSQ